MGAVGCKGIFGEVTKVGKGKEKPLVNRKDAMASNYRVDFLALAHS